MLPLPFQYCARWHKKVQLHFLKDGCSSEFIMIQPPYSFANFQMDLCEVFWNNNQQELFEWKNNYNHIATVHVEYQTHTHTLFCNIKSNKLRTSCSWIFVHFDIFFHNGTFHSLQCNYERTDYTHSPRGINQNNFILIWICKYKYEYIIYNNLNTK